VRGVADVDDPHARVVERDVRVAARHLDGVGAAREVHGGHRARRGRVADVEDRQSRARGGDESVAAGDVHVQREAVGVGLADGPRVERVGQAQDAQAAAPIRDVGVVAGDRHRPRLEDVVVRGAVERRADGMGFAQAGRLRHVDHLQAVETGGNVRRPVAERDLVRVVRQVQLAHQGDAVGRLDLEGLHARLARDRQHAVARHRQVDQRTPCRQQDLQRGDGRPDDVDHRQLAARRAAGARRLPEDRGVGHVQAAARRGQAGAAHAGQRGHLDRPRGVVEVDDPEAVVRVRRQVRVAPYDDDVQRFHRHAAGDRRRNQRANLARPRGIGDVDDAQARVEGRYHGQRARRFEIDRHRGPSGRDAARHARRCRLAHVDDGEAVAVGHVSVAARDPDIRRDAAGGDGAGKRRPRRIGHVDDQEAAGQRGGVGVVAGHDDVLDLVRQRRRLAEPPQLERSRSVAGHGRHDEDVPDPQVRGIAARGDRQRRPAELGDLFKRDGPLRPRAHGSAASERRPDAQSSQGDPTGMPARSPPACPPLRRSFHSHDPFPRLSRRSGHSRRRVATSFNGAGGAFGPARFDAWPGRT